ncbi:MAG: restriction endonuclease subunit S, partial [Erysipelotrichaceae bacterium]
MEMKLGDREWKKFKFTDIFTIKGGFYNKKPALESSGNVPFIGAVDKNNGITELYTMANIDRSSKTGDKKNESIDKKVFKGNCICVTNNGSVGYAYYQEIDFTCSHDVNPLYLKNHKLNRKMALFLIAS